MRLELLTPREWEHPMKKILNVWYQKIGYVQGQKEDFGKLYPEISKMFDCPVDFTVYLKDLK